MFNNSFELFLFQSPTEEIIAIAQEAMIQFALRMEESTPMIVK